MAKDAERIMTQLAALLAYGMLGALVGAIYFATLGWNVRLYTRGRHATRAVAMHGTRLLAVAGCFAAIARVAGAGALLAAFVGFLAARTAAIQLVRNDAQGSP
jgi:F1F0 ATPase subunit 2